MSPIESKLWNFCAKSYLNTHDSSITYLADDLQDWLNTCEGARQLLEDGLIENESDFIHLGFGPVTFNDIIPAIEFDLTDQAIHKIEVEGELES